VFQRRQAGRGQAGRDVDHVAGVALLQPGGGALGDDAPVVDDRQPVAELVGLIQVVSGEEDRGAGAAELAELIPQVGPVLRVKTGGRLIEEQHLRVVHDPQGYLEPAALPAGVAASGPVGECAEVERLDQLVGAPGGLGRAHSVQPPFEQEVLPSGRRRVAGRGTGCSGR